LNIPGENGLDELGEAMGIVLNTAMKLERDRLLGAGPYVRTERRRGRANGFKPKKLKTRVGELGLAVPQMRNLAEGSSGLAQAASSEACARNELFAARLADVRARRIDT